MELKDYINKVEEKKRKQLPPWVRIYQNIEIFNIPNEKLKLIKSFQDYIPCYNFNEYAAKTNDYKQPGYIMQQVKTTNNSTTGILIETKRFCTKSDGYDDYQCYEPLEKQEYQARTNRYKLEGSQEFYKLYICAQGSTFDSKYEISNKLNFTGNLIDAHIFYSKDGNVFLTKVLADKIKQNSEEALGNFLAQEAVQVKVKSFPK